MALSYSNISVELREISLRDRPEELYIASPKGTVPVLITTDQIVIDESIEIILWSLKNNINQTLLNKDSEQDLELIKQNDTTFKKWLDRYKYHDRYPDHTKEYYQNKCSHILLNYEEQLSNTKYLTKNELSIADISIFPFVRQFANVNYEWFKENYIHLSKWLENISSSNLFLSVMNKYETWDNKNTPKIVDFKSNNL